MDCTGDAIFIKVFSSDGFGLAQHKPQLTSRQITQCIPNGSANPLLSIIPHIYYPEGTEHGSGRKRDQEMVNIALLGGWQE